MRIELMDADGASLAETVKTLKPRRHSTVREFDTSIRSALWRWLEAFHVTAPDVRARNEFAVGHGSGYADVVTIHPNSLHGYEIKSERDKLDRLKSQRHYYGDIFDYATLVCDPKHMAHAEEILPRWWGLVFAHRKADEIKFEIWRLPDSNPAPDIRRRAVLLWRAEALALCDTLISGHKLKYATRDDLYCALVDRVPGSVLYPLILKAIRERQSYTLQLAGYSTRKNEWGDE
jgi:hypothetical protein